MKKYLAALAGLVVLVGFGYVVVSMRSNQGKLPWEGAVAKITEAKGMTLPKGTEIELILLEGIDAGGTNEGETVDMGVLKDIKVGGKVVIPMGTRATAEISKSRGASLLGAMANKPARLSMMYKHLTLEDGREIKISGQDGAEEYEFTQANTADRIDAAKIDNLWNDNGARNALTEIAKGAVTGKGLESQEEEVKLLADRLGLEKTKELSSNPTSAAKGVTLDKVLSAMADNDTGGLQGAQAVVLAQAVGEISDMVSSVDHKIRGIFKGRTIRATIGTPVMVWTVSDEKFGVKK
ncbi:MAG: hypothetical protein ACKVQS_09550 [Fimbriimonadaceae bacterium]